ncbi:MAG: type II toxin-antitoxin system HigB family toxin [Trueperaceae bacterium]
MSFNVIAKSALRNFWQRHSESQVALDTWYKAVRNADFANFAELRQVFSSADLIQPDFVVFNVKGNHYRLVTRMSFAYRTIWIKHVFTHAEYDHWNP